MIRLSVCYVPHNISCTKTVSVHERARTVVMLYIFYGACPLCALGTPVTSQSMIYFKSNMLRYRAKTNENVSLLKHLLTALYVIQVDIHHAYSNIHIQML